MNITTNLRLYSFNNFYLNSISQGIQTGHCALRMAKKYKASMYDMSPSAKLFWQWLEQGQQNETIICLNGGMGADIEEAYQKYHNLLGDAGIPSGIFYEEPRAFSNGRYDINSQMFPTSWACVLPQNIWDYDPREAVAGDAIHILEYKLQEFLNYKNSCSFAR